jgi:hypothetical protein
MIERLPRKISSQRRGLEQLILDGLSLAQRDPDRVIILLRKAVKSLYKAVFSMPIAGLYSCR